MKSLFKYGLTITFCFLSLLIAKAAFAQPPASIQGTWNGYWNGTVTGGGLSEKALSVTVNEQYENPEAESDCRFISGDMSVETRTGPLDGDITGFYCPDPVTDPVYEEVYKQGSFAFVLKDKITQEGDRETIRQVYQGEIVPDGEGYAMKGSLLFISGDWGKYTFSAPKQP